MSETRLVVGPLNRVEGDLEVHLDLADGQVASARVTAPLFRGFEQMLEGKDPRDALTVTPRICGIRSISQPAAAAWALGAAAGIQPTPQGAAMAALIHAVEKGRVTGYQIIARTTWNFSPRDAASEVSPVAVQYIVRSFDPRMVCTVH